MSDVYDPYGMARARALAQAMPQAQAPIGGQMVGQLLGGSMVPAQPAQPAGLGIDKELLAKAIEKIGKSPFVEKLRGYPGGIGASQSSI